MSLVEETKQLVDLHLNYVTDEENHGKVEHWQSHADEILAGNGYQADGDCDDFALTYADMLVRAGIERRRISIEYVEIRNYGGHLVCVVDDHKVLDNNFPNVRMKTTLRRREGYRFVSRMRLDQLGVWEEYS